VPAKYIVAVQPSSKQRLVLKEKRMSTSFLSASMVTEAPERSMKPELNRVSFVKRSVSRITLQSCAAAANTNTWQSEKSKYFLKSNSIMESN